MGRAKVDQESKGGEAAMTMTLVLLDDKDVMIDLVLVEREEAKRIWQDVTRAAR